MVTAAAFSTRFVMILPVLAVLVAGCADKPSSSFQGYVEGEFVYVSCPQAGRLDRLDVSRGQQVTNGVTLFFLESDLEDAARHQAQHELSAAEAQLADLQSGRRQPELDVIRAQLSQAHATAQQLTTELAREEVLFKADAITAAQLDQTRAAADTGTARVRELECQIAVAELPAREDQIRAQSAQVNASRAALAQTEWRLHQKSVTAQQSALVFDTLFREGEWVPAGAPVVSLLPPRNVKVRFFIPESRLGALKINQTVTIRRDGTRDVAGNITYISTQAEYTPPVIFSNETRAKLVFMVEAVPTPEATPDMHPGQPVEVFLP